MTANLTRKNERGRHTPVIVTKEMIDELRDGSGILTNKLYIGYKEGTKLRYYPIVMLYRPHAYRVLYSVLHHTPLPNAKQIDRMYDRMERLIGTKDVLWYYNNPYRIMSKGQKQETVDALDTTIRMYAVGTEPRLRALLSLLDISLSTRDLYPENSPEWRVYHHTAEFNLSNLINEIDTPDVKDLNGSHLI